MNIILLGPPASGKGTQAEMLASEFNLYLLQTGNLARKLTKTDPEIKKIYDAGQLIPAELMTMHVINFLTNEKPDLKDILFEGFPRFISQYEALEAFLKNKGDDIDLVFSLEISKETAVERISNRRVCANCGEIYNLVTKPSKTSGVCDKCGNHLVQRNDDKREVVATRFEYFKENTMELIDYLDQNKKLIRINSERPVDEIYKDLVDRVKDAIKQREN